MSKAKIISGVWSRHVPWHQRGKWRTDIFKAVLAEPRLTVCRFILKNGPTVSVPAGEMRRVLLGREGHYSGQIWGAFSLDPSVKGIDGKSVIMDVE